MYIKWLQIGNNHFEFKKRSVSLRNVLKSVFSKKVSAAVLTAVMLFVSVFSMSMIASAASFSPRLSAPSLSNKYYYSDLNAFYKYGYGMPNCTAYAYGRAYEILGSEPKLSWNNAEQWYDYNKSNGYYKYGQTPKVGAIACWSYNGGGGHVAVVEKVENGQITFSNSAWSGKRFYLSYASTSDKNAGGNSWWNFQGYIYLGDFSGSTSTTQATTKKVTYTTGTYKTDVDDYLNMRSGAGTSYSYVTSVPGNVTLCFCFFINGTANNSKAYCTAYHSQSHGSADYCKGNCSADNSQGYTACNNCSCCNSTAYYGTGNNSSCNYTAEQ